MFKQLTKQITNKTTTQDEGRKMEQKGDSKAFFLQ